MRTFLLHCVLVSAVLWSGGPAKAAQEPKPNSPESLRSSIQHLAETFGARYPDAGTYLRRLEAIERGLGAEDRAKKKDAGAAFAVLQREALIANPLVSAHPILFVVRAQYPRDHHNTATMFQTGEPNASKYKGRGFLKVLDVRKGNSVRVLLDPGPTATPRDPEVSYDGKRILFSMRKGPEDNYHIYEMGADGSNLRQLTSAAKVFDVDPAYLPEGDIVFTSSREPKYCGCNMHIMGNIFRMGADGANIHQLGKSTLFEGHSYVMPDGRILYDRWEYVDRNFGDAQGLWTVNPDGTGHAIYWGNATGSPGAVLDARIIPGTPLCLCIFSSCHDRPWGALAILDRRRGLDGRDPVLRTWPATAIGLVNVKGSFDAFTRVTPKYEDPYPLSEHFFLVSRATGKGEAMGIYLVDTFGNEVMLHAESPGCYDPMPIAPHSLPAAVPPRRNYENAPGTFFVQDVYTGPYMQGVERGSVKYLRIVESPEKRNWTRPHWGGQGAHKPAMNWLNFENKRILGTVPVEADGSAYFEVPSDRYIFFQLLDENRMMVQSMRSGTVVQSGEIQGCVGCHEDRLSSPRFPATFSKALQRAPSKLAGWYGPPREFGFQKEVQPVFDRSCVKCHDFGKKAGKKLVLAGDRTVAFSASYIDLWGGGHIKCVGAGPAAVLPAKSWGSHASRLVQVLRGTHPTHAPVKLDKESFDRVVTWLDINAPYYPFYESAFPGNACGRAPITPQQLARLGVLTGYSFVTSHRNRNRAGVSFERPELSPCLQKLDVASPAYAEALGIIRSGQEHLAKTPRCDMEGFVPCETDRARLARYGERCAVEARNREAIRVGGRRYDE